LETALRELVNRANKPVSSLLAGFLFQFRLVKHSKSLWTGEETLQTYAKA